MPIKGASIANGPTISITSGTAVTLTDDGQLVSGGTHVIDASVTDFRIRPNLTFKTKQPSLQTDGVSWSKGRKSVTITHPKVLANLKQEFPSMKIELLDHPEMTVAEVTKLKEWAVQVIWDTDFSNFWSTGSQA